MRKLSTASIIFAVILLLAFPVFAQDEDFRREQERIFHRTEEIGAWHEDISRKISKSDFPISSQEMERFHRVPIVLDKIRELAEEGKFGEAWELIEKVEGGMQNIERRIGSVMDGPKNLDRSLDEEGKERGKFDWEAVGVILVVLGAVTGWVIARRKRKSVSKYLTEIDNVFNQYKMKSKRCEAELYRLKDMISDELKRGKIDENAYVVLDKRIDEYMREVRENELSEKFGGMPQKLKSELNQLLRDGEISEEDYEKFQYLISKSSGMKEEEKEQLDNLMKKWKDKDSK